ncbi:MAG: CoA ester lyase [Pseudomonadota bacterium]
MRSWLFVPGDSPRKIEKAFGTEADVLILDLEDSVAPDRKAEARQLVKAAIANDPGRVAVRINALSTGLAEADLDAVAPAGPAIIVLPKSERGADVGELSAHLSVREAEAGLPDGATKIMAIATETPQSLFHLGNYGGVSDRLRALAWGAEDLSASLGATRLRRPDGAFTETFALARTLCLAGAHAAGALPLDTVHTDLADEDGLRNEATAAAADGFLGKMAIHPAQVSIINQAFTPPPAAVEEARRIVEAFADAPDVGVLAVGGQMVDRPHLVKAQRLLRRMEELERRS